MVSFGFGNMPPMKYSPRAEQIVAAGLRFWKPGMESAANEITGAVLSFLDVGGTERDFVKRGLPDISDRRWLATLFRTCAMSIHQYQHPLDIDPEMMPYAVLDAMACRHTSHQAIDQLAAPVNDPSWQIIMPPMNWLCSCSLHQQEEYYIEDLEKASVAIADRPGNRIVDLGGEWDRSSPELYFQLL